MVAKRSITILPYNLLIHSFSLEIERKPWKRYSFISLLSEDQHSKAKQKLSVSVIFEEEVMTHAASLTHWQTKCFTVVGGSLDSLTVTTVFVAHCYMHVLQTFADNIVSFTFPI